MQPPRIQMFIYAPHFRSITSSHYTKFHVGRNMQGLLYSKYKALAQESILVLSLVQVPVGYIYSIIKFDYNFRNNIST